MLRWTLLKVSRSKQMKDFLMEFSAFRKAKERFVAGETLEELVSCVQGLNAKGIKTSVDYLGENVSSKEQAEANKAMYFSILNRIKEKSLDSHVSVKLTALGLDIDENLCMLNLEEIAAKAHNIGSFVRIDMENSPYTDRTLKLYCNIRKRYANVGIVIQSSLYRSLEDIGRLINKRIANIRLCKGAYLEPPEIAFSKKRDVDASYMQLTQLSLYHCAHTAFATHDEEMISHAKKCAELNGISKNRFEFQMLYGIRSDLQQKLVSEGYRVRVYVPFGTDWYGYFCRRLAERPANVWFVVKNFFK